jgi:hypothetical protein
MIKLDPFALFERISADIPTELHKDLFVTGSLAAAYHFRAKLDGGAVNTKDADLVVHPAGNVGSCQDMARSLLALGWTRTKECYPSPSPEPANLLRAIRLYPPGPHDYFVEFLNLPRQGQIQSLDWIPIELESGWYGLPSFRFLGVTSLHRQTSDAGIQYAAPAMMALANLLAHPELGYERISAGLMKDLLRSAKDLGRVIALARLTGREETETWLETWFIALQQCFPAEWKSLARRTGDGLRELIGDANALEDARKTTDVGLLSGRGVTADMLKATAERLFVDVIDPLAEMA